MRPISPISSADYVECSECGRPWKHAPRSTHYRCVCDQCVPDRMHDKRPFFPRDEQPALALDEAQPVEAAA